jgi:hypothetical protein
MQLHRLTSTALLAFSFQATLVVEAQTPVSVLTVHNDLARTGQNLSETILTPQNVNVTTFGKIFTYPVDGQLYAQPLYVPGVNFPNQGTRNALYLATENDSVYAFDADGIISVPLWRVSFIDPANGITTVPCADQALACNVYPIVGITGTPVIDPSTGTMYLVARTLENKVYFQRLHALDIVTGAEKFGGPVVISGSVPGTGKGSVGGVLPFDPQHGNQRAGLLLLNGIIYLGWSGTEHGWAMAYNAQTLQQTAVFSTTPNGLIGGVWQSGGGIAADGDGNIYFSSGDGTFDVNSGGTDYGDSLMKMSANLTVLDYFAPMDQACRLTQDQDFGAGGPVLLPPQAGTYANELVIAGKGGVPCDPVDAMIYVVNRDNLGQYNATQDQIPQEIAGASGGYWGTPAYWQGPSAAYVYYSGVTGPDSTHAEFPPPSDGPLANVPPTQSTPAENLKAYTLSSGQLSTTPSSQTSTIFPIGATPSISANGSTNGILWAIQRIDKFSSQPGSNLAVLFAYDATNVANELYDSSQAGSRDAAGPANKFAAPTIVNGRVYVGTQSELDVYGLLGPEVILSAAGLTYSTQAVGSSSAAQPVTVINTSNVPVANISISVTGGNAGDYSQTNNCGTSLAAETSCIVNVTFTPSVSGKSYATLSIADNAAGTPQRVSLTGAAVAPAVAVTPKTLWLGKEVVGSTSPGQAVTVKNVGTVPLALSSIHVTGPNKVDFAQKNTCSTPVPVAGTCAITVTFKPTATGDRTASVTITDFAKTSPQVIALHGTGTAH